MQVWQLIIAGIIVHVVLFYSIFDIYFTTPLVHGMTPVKPLGDPPAKRVFLFVADGLRADKFFEHKKNDKNIAPFLRRIVKKEGVWGVSHTRVPTETRPGHVALIAGFYEDVSAVTKGWKENPVEFDSAFNETRQTWSWGSPDVLPMFAKGASGKHVNVSCYSARFEDFARYDKMKLDSWVFDKVKELFSSASSNPILKKQLQEDGLVFFLHLLGLDTNGHSNKPHSSEYMANIELVDEGIRRTVDLVTEFYNNDGKSAYIFTSDHGMTDWGSHGAGDDEETQTPFVAWGAGIRHPIVEDHCGVHSDNLCEKWNLEKIRRTDMEQADVAPLMTALIGVPFPLNSVGRLPIDVLSGSMKDQAELLLMNALQILAQFDVKMIQVKKRTFSATFRPFSKLTEVNKLQSVMHIKQLIQNGRFSESISETKVLIKNALNGLRYFQTYDRLFLGACVVLGFTGWMAYIMSILTFEHTAIGKGVYRDQKTNSRLSQAFGLLAVFVIILLFVQSLPLMCYIYCMLPVFLWYKSASWVRIVLKSVYDLHVKGQLMEVALCVVLCVAGLEIAIFSFYYRELLSVGLTALALKPVIKLRITFDRRCDLMSTDFGWIMSCLITAIFPLMPVIGRDKHYDWVCYSGILAVIFSLIMYSKVAFTTTRNVKLLFLLQIMLVVVSIVIVLVTADSIKDLNGLPLTCQIGSWTILGLFTLFAVLSFVLPLMTPTTIGDRLFSLTLAFLSSYMLLSIAHEIFFFLSLSSLLYFWLKTEADGEQHTFHKIIAYSIPLQNVEQVDFLHHEDFKDNLSRSPSPSRNMELEDLQTAFAFIFFIVTAFFGTGNIASVNSFDPASVYCFLTVFSPFRMGALLMLKIAIPFLLVTCFLHAIVTVTQTSLRSFILIVLIMSDFMGLHFFFLVRDYGSWLEIGTTISHYIIVMTMIIFILLLLGVSYALTSWGKARLRMFLNRICKSKKMGNIL